MESCEGSWSGLRPNTSTAITDSLSWLSLPSSRRSARNLRKRLIRSFRRNPGLARTRSNCRRAPSGSVGAMGTAPSIHLVFSDVQMYETYFQHVRTCSLIPLGAPWEPDWVAKKDTKGEIMRIRYRPAFFGIAFTLAVGLAPAQDLRLVHFKGVINDYSPSTVSGGPWEIRGTWSLDVERSGTANFSADLTMETSDYGV